jgi:peptide-methionine (R)-S-oxide reductase
MTNPPRAPAKRAVEKSEAEWRSQLTPEQYRVTREAGTEPAFRNAYHAHTETGLYHCVCCDAALFDSNEKFPSSCGWPAFDRHSREGIEASDDRSFGMRRTEVKCKQCGAHLGHLFDDGPTDTGQRYCINSASLIFKKIE